MAGFLSWYLLVTALGWVSFPLVFRLFPALPDRGYGFAKAAGLLVWGYVFWLFTSLGLTANTAGGILFSLLPLIGLSLIALYFGFQGDGSAAERLAEFGRWIKRNVALIVSVEALFLVAFAAEAMLRAGNPTLDNAEKPMELMFINSILRSPTFPPHDSWLSGYAISYYYFGYVLAGMLAELSGVSGSVAHNLMTSLIFGLAASGAYGIVYDLLAVREHSRAPQQGERRARPRVIGASFLAPLFLLLVSNLEGFLEVLHRAGLFWSDTQNLWTWLGIKDLSEAPALPLQLTPDRFWWWWRASRVVSDFDLAGNFREVIDEFPFFSFLHADLHPHVLAIPFNLLALAIALNLFLGGWRGQTNLFRLKLRIHPAGFIAAALTLGGLAFLNTWDILVGGVLMVAAYALLRVQEDGWSWDRLGDALALGLPLGVLAFVFYLPFYFGFSSQARGLLPNLISPTRGAQLWVMFAPLFVPLLALFIFAWRRERRAARWKLAAWISIGFVLMLWAASWLMGLAAFKVDPGFVAGFLGVQGTPDITMFLSEAMSRRLSYIGGLLTLLAILWPALAFVIAARRGSEEPEAARASKRPAKRGGATTPATPGSATASDRSPTFVFMLTVVGCALVIAPEFVFLRDQFGSRLNTIFKFYYQAWLLWSVAAAFGTAVLLRELRRLWGWVFAVGLVVLLAMALTYPVLAVANKTNDFKPPLGWTLDDFARIQRGNPDEAAAINWLRSAPYGVVAEAVGGSYTGFGRISEYTGLPAVLGWPGHESQWRGTYAPQGTRQDDMSLLYTTPDWNTALDIIRRYGIRYVYVGALERSTYTVEEQKFQQNLSVAFQQGQVTIYEAPGPYAVPRNPSE
jgi:YYY domain-containing protein